MGMAATRLIALHVNKGKTVAQCLADRTDYSQNAAKTNDGEFISSYECDPKTADEESLYEEFHQLAVQKKQDYAEYRQIRKEKEELLIAKRTVETILNIDRQKEQEKEQEKEEKKNFR